MASADPDEGSFGARMVQKGIEYFYIGIADDLYALGYHPPGHNTTDDASNAEIFIYELTTFTVDPYKDPAVTDFRRKCALWAGIYAVTYTMIGGISCIGSTALHHDAGNRGRRIKGFFTNLAVSICVIVFADFYIMAIIMINFLLVSLLISSLLSATTIAVANDNSMLYLAMSVAYVVEFGFMLARCLLIYIFAATGRLIGALLISDRTRGIGLTITYYLTGVVFLQSVIVLITSAGYLGIDAMRSAGAFPIGSSGEHLLYAILILILIGASLAILIGLVRMKHTVITTVKMVI